MSKEEKEIYLQGFVNGYLKATSICLDIDKQTLSKMLVEIIEQSK
ncbi:hypothetical protein [Bacillus pseudomycoides]|nr:hypothetical protein [Bacillus pseudomycoides]